MPTVNISITITDNELTALQAVAAKNDMTAQAYGELVLRSAVKTALKGHYKKRFNTLTLIELAELFGDL